MKQNNTVYPEKTLAMYPLIEQLSYSQYCLNRIREAEAKWHIELATPEVEDNENERVGAAGSRNLERSQIL